MNQKQYLNDLVCSSTDSTTIEFLDTVNNLDDYNEADYG